MREVDVARREVLARREDEALLEGGVEVNDDDFHIIPVHFIFPSTRRFSRHREKGGSDPFSSEQFPSPMHLGPTRFPAGLLCRWEVVGSELSQGGGYRSGYHCNDED